MLARRPALAVAAAVLLLGGLPLSGIVPSRVLAGASTTPVSRSIDGMEDSGQPSSSSTHDVSLSTPWTVFDEGVDVVAGNLSFAQTGPDHSVSRLCHDDRAHIQQLDIDDRGALRSGLVLVALACIVVAGSGAVDLVRADGRLDHYVSAGSGTYTAPTGIYDTLVDRVGGGWTLTLTDRTTYTFNSDGTLASESDPNGNTLSLAYASERVSSLTDTAGRTWTFKAASDGTHVGEIDDPAGRAATYAYSTDGYLASATPSGLARSRTASGYLRSEDPTSVTDPDGHATTFAYD